MEKWYKERGQEYPNWSSEELRKAETILGLLYEKKLEKVDVIAHSEGAINVCIAAMLHPEKFSGRTIVLANPAGMIGKDNIFRLRKGSGAATGRTETMSKFPTTKAESEYLESTKHITPDYMRAGLVRAFKETLAISQAQIEDMLKYLREKGIKIIVIAGIDDPIFPTESMQKNVKKDFIDGFLSIRGGHMQLQVHPELYMAAAENMLSQSGKEKDK